MSCTLSKTQEQIANLLLQALEIDEVEACRMMMAMPFSLMTARHYDTPNPQIMMTLKGMREEVEDNYLSACNRVADKAGETQ